MRENENNHCITQSKWVHDNSSNNINARARRWPMLSQANIRIKMFGIFWQAANVNDNCRFGQTHNYFFHAYD